MPDLTGITIGFAMTGSFCTFDDAFKQANILKQSGADLIPIMSENAYNINTRFGEAKNHINKLSEICGKEIINSISGAEPLGPKKMADVLLVCPCTGNTMAKLANSITDTPVTMAVKAHIRNNRPAVLCIATNDALAGSAKNIGVLMNLRNYFFVPLKQDDPQDKPTSIISDFSKVPESIISALKGIQLQPLIFS
jgi:dipicolinate synthase subunit B